MARKGVCAVDYRLGGRDSPGRLNVPALRDHGAGDDLCGGAMRKQRRAGFDTRGKKPLRQFGRVAGSRGPLVRADRLLDSGALLRLLALVERDMAYVSARILELLEASGVELGEFGGEAHIQRSGWVEITRHIMFLDKLIHLLKHISLIGNYFQCLFRAMYASVDLEPAERVWADMTRVTTRCAGRSLTGFENEDLRAGNAGGVDQLEGCKCARDSGAYDEVFCWC